MRVFRIVLCLAAILGCQSPMTLPAPPPDAARPGTVTGRIVVAVPGQANRVPVPGASVLLLRSDVVATTDSDGRFALTGLALNGSVLLVRWDSDRDGSFEHQKLINVDQLGGGPGHDLSLGDVPLAENGTIRGRILLADVLPARGGHGGTSVFVPEGPFIAYTGDDGAFVLPELPEGELTFGLFHAGHEPQAVDHLVLRPGESITLKDLVLQPVSGTPATSPGTLSGRVIANPAADLTQIHAESRTTDGATSLTIAADGTFTASVPAGLHFVTFSLEGYGTAQVANVLVLPGANRELATVTLTQGGDAPVALDAGIPADAGISPTWDAPVARLASPGAVAAGARIDLDGTLSSAAFAPAGAFLSYRWRQTAGDDVSASFSANDSVLAGRLTATAPDKAQRLAFELAVTDTRTGLVGTATANVEVIQPPRAVVTPSEALVHPGTDVVFDAQQSTDASGAALSYRWRGLDGITVSPADQGKSALTVTAPAAEGTYSLELVVSNGFVSSAPALATLTVAAGSSAPTVDAGADRVVAAGGVVHLAAQVKSADPVTYAWQQLSGPPVALSGASAAIATFTAPASFARLGFRVTVGNSSGTASDDVVLEVQDLSPPKLVETDPLADGASSGGFVLSATFDEPLDRTSVTDTTVQVLDPSSTAVACTLRLENERKIVILPRQPLMPGAGYVLKLGAVRDASPNANAHVEERRTFNVRPPRFTTWANPLASKTPAYPGVASNGRETFVFAQYSSIPVGQNGTEYAAGIWKPGSNGELVLAKPLDNVPRDWYVPTGKRAFAVPGGGIWGIGSTTGYGYSGWWYARTAAGFTSFGPGHLYAFAGGDTMYVLWENYGFHISTLNAATNQFVGDEYWTESSYSPNPAGVSFDRAAGTMLADGRLFAVGVSTWGGGTTRYLLPYAKTSGAWAHVSTPFANNSLAAASTISPRVVAMGNSPFVAWMDVEGSPKFAAAIQRPTGWSPYPDLGPKGVAVNFDLASRGDTGWVAYATGSGLYLRRFDLAGPNADGLDVPGPNGDNHAIDAACATDHPELSAADDGLWMTWSERCADDAYKVYLRKLE